MGTKADFLYFPSYVRVVVFYGRSDDCEELSGGYSQEMMGL